MTDVQTGWYIRLRAFAWRAGGFLPADHDRLWRLARAQSREIFDGDCELILEEYEEVSIDSKPMLKHPQWAAQYLETLDKWMSKKQAGLASKASIHARETVS